MLRISIVKTRRLQILDQSIMGWLVHAWAVDLCLCLMWVVDFNVDLPRKRIKFKRQNIDQNNRMKNNTLEIPGKKTSKFHRNIRDSRKNPSKFQQNIQQKSHPQLSKWPWPWPLPLPLPPLAPSHPSHPSPAPRGPDCSASAERRDRWR